MITNDDLLLYDVADFFKVFGDSTRLKILLTLLDNEMCVSCIVKELNMNQSAVSHQLRVLRQNGLVKYVKKGKENIYSLDDEHIATVLHQGIDHIMHRKSY